MRYLRLLSRVAGATWAIEDVTAKSLIGMLWYLAKHAEGDAPPVRLGWRSRDMRADDTPWDDERQEERSAARRAEREQAQADRGGIAIVPVTGVISPRLHDVEGLSTGGGLSAEGFAATMRQLATDPAVQGVVLDVDSPGGNVAGIPEAVAAMRDFKASGKPLSAVANHWAASAAYWLASNADELVITPSGDVGSIGVYVYHEDFSKHMEMLGVTPTLIKAKDSPNKAEGHPAFPLAPEGLDHLQARVDEYQAMFIKDVAKGRGVSVATVRNEFGGGRMIGAEDAVKRGMADRVGDLADTIKRMQRRVGKAARPASSLASRRRRLAVA